MTKRQIAKFLILRTLGNFLILFMIFGFVFTFGPALFYEARFRIEQARGIRYALPANTQPSALAKIIEARTHTPPTVAESLLGGAFSNKKIQTIIPASTDFSVVIPKIGANEKVTPNVDASDPNQYLEVLRHTVAHAKGSSLPGLNGTTYLFAHSADNFWDVGRYNAVFYLLKDLNLGDDISVFFQERRYNYTVYDKKIVDPSDVGYMAANIGQGERLILQTCWPPGTAWKRLLIFAKPKNS
ncbi:MAG: sortase [Candidatus Levyibacteriota bacterium]